MLPQKLNLDPIATNHVGIDTNAQCRPCDIILNDPKTSELFARVAMGEGIGEIRMPNDVGIAGTVFQSQKTINIPHAYADLHLTRASTSRLVISQVQYFASPLSIRRANVLDVHKH